MKVTLHSHHNPSLLPSNKVGSTPWPDNIWDTSDQPHIYDLIEHPLTVAKWTVTNQTLVSPTCNVTHCGCVLGNPFHPIQIPVDHENKAKHKYRISRPIRRTMIFFWLMNLILVIYWKKTGLLHILLQESKPFTSSDAWSHDLEANFTILQ
jgi:hypothetical protein